mgnify:CR=1 FL=1
MHNSRAIAGDPLFVRAQFFECLDDVVFAFGKPALTGECEPERAERALRRAQAPAERTDSGAIVIQQGLAENGLGFVVAVLADECQTEFRPDIGDRGFSMG